MGRDDNETVELELHLHYETAPDRGALLVSEDGNEKNARWIPKSLIEDREDDEKHKTVTITIPEWLAKREGLI